MEGLSTVVEGVHLVPGLVAPEQQPGATVVQVLLTIQDEEAHQSHFVARDRIAGGARALDRYLRSGSATSAASRTTWWRGRSGWACP